MTGKDGTAVAAAADVDLSASSRAFVTRLERLHCHGSLTMEQHSTLATATDSSVAPSQFLTDLGPARSRVPSIAPSGVVGCPRSAVLMVPSPPRILPADASQRSRMVTCKLHFMAAAPEWFGLTAGQKLALTIALLMSESFVHKTIIAGCGCFVSHLPSGPHEEGGHAAQ